MELPVDQIGLWLGCDLLATTARLAEGWCVGPAARIAARQAARRRADRSFMRCRRFLVGTSCWGGRKTDSNPTDRSRPGSTHHILIDANGVPIRAILSGANSNDATQLLPLVDTIAPIRGVRGRPLQKPEVIYADRGYDSEPHRRKLRERGIKPVIARRRTGHGSGLGGIVYVPPRHPCIIDPVTRQKYFYLVDIARYDVHLFSLLNVCVFDRDRTRGVSLVGSSGLVKHSLR
jgi:hypothetical protein